MYEFDTLGRLKAAKGGLAAGVGNPSANWTQVYLYDRYGNRTGGGPAGVTANNQPVPSDGLTNLGYDQASNRISTPGYQYDLAGNLTRGQDQNGNWQRYEYDAAGRLVDVKDDNGVMLTHNGYASTRQRLLKFEGGVFTWYVWSGSQTIAEYTAAGWGGPVTRSKEYFYAGSRLLSTITNVGGSEVTEFQHPDRLNTKLVTNNAANTSFEQSTLPFGTELAAESTGASNQRFTSYDRSTVASLDYAVNRSYANGQGRFTSPDPIGMGATNLSNPQSMNLYAYVQNNPIDFTDPSGLLIAIPRCQTGCVLNFKADGTPYWDCVQTCQWELIGIGGPPSITPPTQGNPGSDSGGGSGGTGSPVTPTQPSKSDNDCDKLGKDPRFKEFAGKLIRKGGGNPNKAGKAGNPLTEAAGLFGNIIDNGEMGKNQSGYWIYPKGGGGQSVAATTEMFGQIETLAGQMNYAYSAHTHPSGRLNPSTPGNNALNDDTAGDTESLSLLSQAKYSDGSDRLVNPNIKGVIIANHQFSVWNKNGKVDCIGRW